MGSKLASKAIIKQPVRNIRIKKARSEDEMIFTVLLGSSLFSRVGRPACVFGSELSFPVLFSVTRFRTF